LPPAPFAEVTTAKLISGRGPSTILQWADHYRLFAEKATDPQRQARFREIAEIFERQIDAIRADNASVQTQKQI